MFKRWLKKESTVFDYSTLGLDKSVPIGNDMRIAMKDRMKKYNELEKDINGKHTSNMLESNKRILIDSILDKLRNLRKDAEEGKVYKDDYRNLKEKFLKLLFQFFESYENMDNIDYTFALLEDMEMIPKNSKDDILKRYCFTGRWF